MPEIDQTIALLDTGISLEDLDALPPAKLHRFSALCHHWHMLADARVRKQPQPQRESGVLAALRNGARQE
jgi:hypothetical protein